MQHTYLHADTILCSMQSEKLFSKESTSVKHIIVENTEVMNKSRRAYAYADVSMYTYVKILSG